MNDHATVVRCLNEVPEPAWERLLRDSTANSVFSSLPWLKAWRDSIGVDRQLVIPLLFREDQLIAALPLENRDGVLGFAAPERRDYCDVLICRKFDHNERMAVLNLLLKHAVAAVPEFRHFELNRVPESSPLASAMSGGTDFHVTRRSCVAAPRMDMATVEEKLRKKSLRRHANSLARKGEVACATLRTDADVAPLLDSFFDQHIQRWQDTDSPSLFLEPANREFYRALSSRLGEAGCLRFSTVRLNGDLVAAHFGFHFAGVFTWYKPSFDPSLAKLSPGEVLIKYLLEVAREEAAEVFDFTIGEEAFKLRFATDVPQVADLHLTDSLLAASLKRGKSAVAKMLRG